MNIFHDYFWYVPSNKYYGHTIEKTGKLGFPSASGQNGTARERRSKWEGPFKNETKRTLFELNILIKIKT